MTDRPRMVLSRRRLLLGGATLVGCAATGAGAWARGLAAGRRKREGDVRKSVALHNLHTDERIEVEYWRDSDYVPGALAAIEHVLRDFRNNERHAIDPRLIDYLFEVATASGVDPSFGVISGYRSPQTNEQLRERSSGVAQRSMHLQGRAIDVRLHGVDCQRLATHALAMSRGGVGYYAKSDFVHLDTGAFRSWRG